MTRLKLLASTFLTLCFMVYSDRLAHAETGDAGSDSGQHKTRAADYLGKPNWGNTFSGPLCGVYAACRAVELTGIDANPLNFFMAKYVGNSKGSSPEEVAQVVRDAGAHAEIFSGLSAFDLRSIDCPIIANVRTSINSPQFDHWVVVLPRASGVTIFDGVKIPYNAQISEFLGVWSGIGLCVTRDGSSPLIPIWVGRSWLSISVLIVLLSLLHSRTFLTWVGHLSTLRQLCLILFASLLLVIPGNLLFGDLLHHNKGVKIATAASIPANYHIGTLDDIVSASTNGSMLLVDARLKEDYLLGTIDGAVNIPVTASHWEIEDFVKELPRSTPITIFCQSASCKFDESIALELTSLGFDNLTVSREGWAEYKKVSTINTHP